MPRDIDVITKEMDALSRNIDVWQALVNIKMREKVVPVDTIKLYHELIDKAFLIQDALIIEKKAHPNLQNSNNDEEAKEELAISIEPAINPESVKNPAEMVGGKRQKKRKSKKQMKKRKSGKKTRRSKK